jgi:hypothetical protein
MNSEECTSYKGCPVKELLEKQIAALGDKTELNIRLNQETFTRNERIMDERLARMNEFRDALKDQAGTFVTKEEMAIRVAALVAQVDDLRLSKAFLEGRASQTSVYVAYGLGILSLLIGVASLLVRMTH